MQKSERADPGKLRIADINVPIPSCGQVGFIIQRLTVPTDHIPFIHKYLGYPIAVHCEYLNPLIPGIGNIKVPIIIHGQTRGLIKLAITKTYFSKLSDKDTIGVKDSDPLIPGICDINMSVPIYNYISRTPKGVRCFPLAKMPPGSDKPSLC